MNRAHRLWRRSSGRGAVRDFWIYRKSPGELPLDFIGTPQPSALLRSGENRAFLTEKKGDNG
jgi:hypothetical protein